MPDWLTGRFPKFSQDRLLLVVDLIGTFVFAVEGALAGIDAGPWQYLEPVGKVSDSLTEAYDFTVDAPEATVAGPEAKEHVLAVRVYDRYENVVAVKAVVR